MGQFNDIENDRDHAARRAEHDLLRRIDHTLERLAGLDGSPEAAPVRAAMQRELQQLDAELTASRRARLQVKPAGSGQMMGHATTGIEAEVQLRMEYVPTGVVHLLGPVSLFGGSRPLVNVAIRWQQGMAGAGILGGSPGFKRLRVEAIVEGYSAREVQTREVAVAEGQASFALMPAFFPERLAAVSETRVAGLHVRVSQFIGEAGREAIELERTFSIKLLARQAACVFMMDPTLAEVRDYSYALGAWVTPNEPSVLALLAGTAGADRDGFFGRQGRVEAQLEHQVRLLHDALAGLGWRYATFITATPRVDGTIFQRVRLPRETLGLRAANCLDGALLFASLLEAASLEPALVLLRNHALVAWRRFNHDGAGEWAYLDTTYLGRGTFEQARQAGERQAAVHRHMAEQSGRPEYFRLWPLTELRGRGIIPIE